MKYLILSLLILLSGCSWFKPKPEIVYIYKEVKVPVKEKINIAEFPPVEIPVRKLNSKSSDAETAQAYRDSVLILNNEVKKRDNIFNELRNKNEEK